MRDLMPRRHDCVAFSKRSFCQGFRQNPGHCKLRESMNLAQNAHSCLYTPFLFISVLKSDIPGLEAGQWRQWRQWRAGQWGTPLGGRAPQNSHIGLRVCHFFIPIPLQMNSSLEPCKDTANSLQYKKGLEKGWYHYEYGWREPIPR